MSHSEISELLGAWALDAVDRDEAARIEEHLAQCPRCRDEVAEHREVAGRMAFPGDTAPEGLWDRIAASLEETPPPLDMSRIVPLDRARRQRSVRVRTFGALVAAAAVVIAGLGIEVRRLEAKNRRIDAAVHRLQSDDNIGKVAAESGTTALTLRSFNGRLTAKAFLSAQGESVIDARNLPALPIDREYQLWGLVNGSKVSLRLLGAHPGVVQFRAGPTVAALAVTDEPSGGVPTSEQAAVVTGYL
ncbi:MAG: hypothetical protein QOG64_1215 [Acidimicrobiaceae bacterium]|nr:hypothetical protein [Acidimicrobiaceae bacterium]